MKGGVLGFIAGTGVAVSAGDDAHQGCDLSEGMSHAPAELTATGNGDQTRDRGGGTGTSPARISPTSSDGRACARP
jgi:hypothetical protein